MRRAILGLVLFIPSFSKCQGSAPATQMAVGAVRQPGTLPKQNILTVEEAVQLAEQYSPLLKAGEAQIEGAKAAIVTAGTYANPEFNLIDGNQSTRLPIAVSGTLQHYGVAQRIELPFQRNARLKAAHIGRESSELSMAERRLEVRGAVKQAFFTVLRRKQEREIAEQNQKIVEDFQRRIAVQVKTGEAAKLELTRADAEVASARSLVKSAQLQEVAAAATLRVVTGAPKELVLAPEGALDVAPKLPDMATLLPRVLAQHPALAVAKTEVQRSEAILHAEKTLRVPQPTALAEFEQQPDLRFYRVGFSLPLPVFDRRQGPIREAAARVHETSALAEQERLQLTSDLETAYGQFQIADQQVNTLANGALKQAAAALAAAEAAYKFGERGIIDVLDAQRVLRRVRLDFVNAQYDREAALIELEQLKALTL